MGTGASTSLPELVDKHQAKAAAGDRFDEAAFDAAAVDGRVPREVLLKAAGLEALDKPAATFGAASNFLASNRRNPAAMPMAGEHAAGVLGQYDKEVVTAALSLQHVTRGDGFLGAEVRKSTDSESLFAATWGSIGRGELHEAKQSIESALLLDPANEKFYYTRALIYARTAEWRWALADYTQYLNLTQIVAGPQLANAYYSRALCLAKLGHRLQALRDLDRCIKVGPTDEQVTDKDASLVPCAVVARYAMISADPELGLQAAKEAADEAAAAKRKQASSEAAAGGTDRSSQDTVYEGLCWQVAITDLEGCIERALASRKTPLLLDRTREQVVDKYYFYQPSTVIEAKRLILEARVANVNMDLVRETLRVQLVHALRWGHTLLIRLTNTAADFANAYCHPDYFPLEVFDPGTHPTSQDASASPVWKRVVRESDMDASKTLTVPSTFRVVLSSTFPPDKYEQYLAESLPLAKLQPAHLIDPTSKGSGADATPLLKGQIAGEQLKGDRTSLVLQGWGKGPGPDKNPAGRPMGMCDSIAGMS